MSISSVVVAQMIVPNNSSIQPKSLSWVSSGAVLCCDGTYVPSTQYKVLCATWLHPGISETANHYLTPLEERKRQDRRGSDEAKKEILRWYLSKDQQEIGCSWLPSLLTLVPECLSEG